MDKKIKIFVDHVGRSCDGCTKCCEGYLTTEIYNFPVDPNNGACRFLSRGGCSIYSLRPYDPCKTFQCGWKENTRIPEELKPNKSNVILLIRYMEGFYFYRIARASSKIDPNVLKWAEDFAKEGHHLTAYDQDGRLLIFSENRKFRELARKLLKSM